MKKRAPDESGAPSRVFVEWFEVLLEMSS